MPVHAGEKMPPKVHISPFCELDLTSDLKTEERYVYIFILYER